MEMAITFINHIFDFIWSLFSGTPPYIDLIAISALSAFGFLLIYKKTSNQVMIRYHKDKIIAHILRIRLYRDQPMLTIEAILNILKHNIIYLRYAVIPLMVIIIPLMVLSLQLNNRYGYKPLGPNKSFIIQAGLDKHIVTDIAGSIENVQLYVPEGISLETPPLRIISEGGILWRARITNSHIKGPILRIVLNKSGGEVEKRVQTTLNKERFSPHKGKGNLLKSLFSNAEDFIPGKSPFRTFSVQYMRSTYPFLCWDMDPIVLYFVLTLILAFLFKPFFKIVI